jgi:ribosome-associated protein
VPTRFLTQAFRPDRAGRSAPTSGLARSLAGWHLSRAVAISRALRIADGVEVPAHEVDVSFSRASGPGGQHVNKTETRVTLRFPLLQSPSISETRKADMLKKLSARLTNDGELLVSCDTYRERARNLDEATLRLEALLQKAYALPKKRRKTVASRGSKERRLKSKQVTSEKKVGRKSVRPDNE